VLLRRLALPLPPMRALRPACALMLSLILVAGLAGPAAADDLLTKVNASRQEGVTLLQVAEATAQRSAASQAAAGELSHTNLDPLLKVCSAAGEVVGFGPTTDAIFDAFAASPTHWDIITSANWTSAGTGTAVGSDGALYVSIVFCQDAVDAPAPPMKAGAATRPSAAPPRRQPMEPVPANACTLDRDLVLHEPPWETGNCPGVT